MGAKKTLFIMIALVLTACVDNYTEVTLAEESVACDPTTLTRANGDCSVGNNNQKFLFSQTDAGYTTALTAYGQRYQPQNDVMVMLEVWNNELTASTMSGDGSILVAFATVTTQNKSIFSITDTYSAHADQPSLCLKRTIVVKGKGSGDRSFNSIILLRKSQPQSYTTNEYYIPALVFKDGSNMSDVSIGSSWNDDWILAREERMGLPLAMMRDKSSRVALSICDYNLNPTTSNNDWGNTHLATTTFKYASLGYNLQGEAPALAYCYPGSEGERSYSDGGGHAAKRADRSRSVRSAVRSRGGEL